MLSRLIPTAALGIALAVVPAAGHGQVTASVSLQMGVFDGAGMGLAYSHWGPGSIYSPAFHAGIGASLGIGIGVGVGSHWGSGYGAYDDYYYDDYYYDDYDRGGYHRQGYFGGYGRGRYADFTSPYCRWWGYPDSCWDSWDPVFRVYRLPVQPGVGLELLQKAGLFRSLVGAGRILRPLATGLGL